MKICNTKGCENGAQHKTIKSGKTTYRCCKCHVKNGNSLSSWHSLCMKTYKELQKNKN